jgi:hypothetical protein
VSLFYNFRIIRFEDFVDNDQNQIEDLLSFVQLRLQPNMKTFLIAKKIGALSQSVQVKVKGPAKQRFADSDPTELGFQNNLKISDWRRELDPKRVMEIQVPSSIVIGKINSSLGIKLVSKKLGSKIID